ncbi:MAG: hypothetical protein OQK12_12275 [Motiliproteus sp.]|nr:hypothetical protein [Motiliproteus sp.]MCW9053552.1 hypothetical protein [Motiliproteus sp.]
MAESFSTNNFTSIEYPFNSRILTPWLASFLSEDIIKGFSWINAFSTILFIYFCFHITRKLQLNNLVFLGLSSWFFIHPLGFQFYLASPASVDPFTYALLALTTLLFLSKLRVLMWATIFISLLAKESFIFISLLVIAAELAYICVIRDRRSLSSITSVFLGFMVITLYSHIKTIIGTDFFPQTQEWEISTIDTISWWAREAYNSPERIIVWAGSFFCATGLYSAFLTINIMRERDPIEIRTLTFLGLGSAGYVALGLLAGSDMSRIIFNGNLFILLFCLLSFHYLKLPHTYAASITSISIISSLFYTNFFPAPFEYKYYTNGNDITSTSIYLALNIFTLLLLRIIMKKKNGSNMIHSTAIIENGAKIGSNVTIGAYTIIGKNVIVGDDTIIQNNCELGVHSIEDNSAPLIIGNKSLIRSSSIFYSGSTFGSMLNTGHRVTVREGVTAGENLQIGTLCDIQGDCIIGNYVRMHSNVHIGKHSVIGNFVWIFPYVVLTNDPHPPSNVMKGVTIEDYVALSTMSVILPGVKIRRGTLIGAHSLVSKDTNEDVLVAGNPATEICSTSKMKLKDGSRQPAYPWRRHFHRGYPLDIVDEWKAEFPT